MPDDIAMVLTTYHTPARTKMYQDVIEWWLQNVTELTMPLYVTDSANVGFPVLEQRYGPHRLRVLKYNQAEELSKRSYEATRLVSLERLELELALERLPELRDKQFVVKLTGKYRLPGLSSALYDALTQEPTIWVQHPDSLPLHEEFKTGSHWEHTEVYAMRPYLLRSFLNSIPPMPDEGMLMESYFAKWLQDTRPLGHPIGTLPRMAVPYEFRVKRSDGKVLDHL